MVVLTETKVVGAKVDTIMANFNFPNSAKVDVVGLSRGIYILWNNHVNIQPIALTEQEVYLFVKVPSLAQSFYITAIYAKPYISFKHMMWDNLNSFASHYNNPWLVLGNFNDIASPNEKFGGRPPNLNRIATFNKNLDYYNLIDLGFKGPKFTWTNNRRNSNLVMERLDRFLANPNWLNMFPKASVEHLTKTYSDHCPLILDTNPNFNIFVPKKPL